MKDWSEVRSEEGEAPRSTEDVSEPDFAEMLYSFAEEVHLDKCVDAAFVGTEEAQAAEKLILLTKFMVPKTKRFTKKRCYSKKKKI